MSETEQHFLEIVNLRKGFGSGDTRREVLRGLSFPVSKGEFCVLPGSPTTRHACMPAAEGPPPGGGPSAFIATYRQSWYISLVLAGGAAGNNRKIRRFSAHRVPEERRKKQKRKKRKDIGNSI